MKFINYPLHSGECTVNFLVTTREIALNLRADNDLKDFHSDELEALSNEAEKVFEGIEIGHNHICGAGLEVGIFCKDDDLTIESMFEKWYKLCKKHNVHLIEHGSKEHNEIGFD